MPKKNKGAYVAYRKDRGTWGVLEYIGGRAVWHVGGLTSRAEAEVTLAKRILQNGKRDTDTVRIGELMAYYLEHRAPELAAPENALTFHKNLAPFWADKKLSDITKANTAQYKTERNADYRAYQARKKFKTIKPISDAAIRRELEHLRACINLSYKDGVIKSSPFIPMPDSGKSKERWLTRSEVARLVRTARNMRYAYRYLPYFILIAYKTGPRKTQLLTSRWPHVDLNQGTIDYRHAVNSGNKGAAVAPLTPTLLTIMRGMRRKSTDLGYIIHNMQKPIANIDHSFKACCEVAGIKDATIHTLRHSFASDLKQNGANVADIAEALGHKSTNMVDSTYAHMGLGYISRLKEIMR